MRRRITHHEGITMKTKRPTTQKPKMTADQALYQRAIDLYFTQDVQITAKAAWGQRPRTIAELIATYA